MSLESFKHKQAEKLSEICGYTGVFGMLISITCMVQHMIYGLSHWLIYLIALFYCFAIISYLLLALQKQYAPLLIIIVAALSLADVLMLFIFHVISLIVVVLLLYSVIAASLLYMEGIAGRLRMRAIEKRREDDEWRERI